MCDRCVQDIAVELGERVQRLGAGAESMSGDTLAVAALHLPPGTVHRLVPLQSQVLSQLTQGHQLPLRHTHVSQVSPVRVLRAPETALPLGRMTNVITLAARYVLCLPRISSFVRLPDGFGDNGKQNGVFCCCLEAKG